VPSLIDSLFLEIGLDASKFRTGQKTAQESFKKTKEDAAAAGKDIEASGQRAANFFSGLKTQALELFAILAGGKGLVEFSTGLVQADAQVGRVSRSLDISVGALSAWQGAARLAGLAPEGITSSMQSLSQELQKFLLTGESSVIPYFRALGISIVDQQGKIKTVTELFRDLAAELPKLDPARAKAITNAIGLDDNAYNLLVRGTGELDRLLGQMRQIGTATDESAAASQRLLGYWGQLIVSGEALGRTIATKIVPAVEDYFRALEPRTNAVVEDLKALDAFLFGPKFGLFGTSGRGTTVPAAPPGAPIASALRTKAGAEAGGDTSLGILALAHALQAQIPDLERFTALNDAYHAGTGSQHARGLALDFTLRDPGRSADVAARIRAQLAAQGVDARVIDEYLNPSPGSTGGHIHVGFANALAAQRYSDLARSAGVPGAGGQSSSVQISVGDVTIQTSEATGPGIARDFKASLMSYADRHGLATQANAGAQ
jgi:hypothetical protein